MKKDLLLLVAAVLLVVSCKKDNTIRVQTSGGGKHAIKLAIAPFTQQVGKLSSLRGQRKSAVQAEQEPVDQYLNQLSYLVYGSNGDLLLNRKQFATDSLFGSFTDSLADGTYTVVVTGAGGLPQEQPEVYGTTLNTSGLKFDFSTFYPDHSISDYFFRKLKLDVRGEDVSQEVVLERIVGRLELELVDPENLYFDSGNHFDEAVFQIDGESDTFQFATESSGPPTINSLRFDELGGSLILNTTTPFTVTVSYFDYLGNILAQKKIPNVRCYKNKVTRLKGRLFTPDNPNSEFTISIDDNWGTDSTQVNF